MRCCSGDKVFKYCSRLRTMSWSKRATFGGAAGAGGGPLHELVASFVHRSNLLKLWEKTETEGVSASGAYGPKHVAITRLAAPYAALESDHFSHGAALVRRCDPPSWPMRTALALPETCNQF